MTRETTSVKERRLSSACQPQSTETGAYGTYTMFMEELHGQRWVNLCHK
jgi:hypothetical protein